MKDQMEESLIALQKYFDSPEFEEEKKLMKIKQDILVKRYEKLKAYLKSFSRGQLEKFMDRLMEEHNEELSQYWYDKGCMPCLTNKMNFLFEYMFYENSLSKGLKLEGKEYAKYATGFSDAMVKYRGYVFQMFFGQGVAYRINRNNDILFQW